MTISFPESAAAVIDVTKPPYNCDPTGRTDCTETLRRLVTTLQMEVYEAFLDTKRVLAEGSDEYFLGFETGERKGVVFPARTPPPRILYFPNGIYRLSDTVTYVVPDLQNDLGAEINRNIHLVGESEEGVVLRLDDDAPGYDAGADKPVLDLMRGSRSNVSMQNSVENLTVEVGAGNPGAIGLRFSPTIRGQFGTSRSGLPIRPAPGAWVWRWTGTSSPPPSFSTSRSRDSISGSTSLTFESTPSTSTSCSVTNALRECASTSRLWPFATW